MLTVEYTAVFTAILGFVVRELFSILPAISANDASPDKFSFSYYFSRPRNRVLLAMNASGAALMFLVRHEVVTHSAKLPFLGEYIGAGTPLITAGLSGFVGAHILRIIFNKTSGNKLPE